MFMHGDLNFCYIFIGSDITMMCRSHDDYNEKHNGMDCCKYVSV